MPITVHFRNNRSAKGAMLTHGNYFTAIHNECDVLTMKQDDVYMGIYPMAQ